MKLKSILVAAAAASVFGVAAAHAEDLKVGVAAPMTGSNATFGDQIRRGAEQAVADINAAGGVNGQKLVLEVGDDACDPKQAVAVANQLAKAGVKFVDGHYCSGSSIPASQVYTEESMIQISPGSTNPKLTEQGFKNVFRVCGRDDQQGAIAGAYLAKKFGDKNIAIIHDKSAYGKGLADETQKALNAANVKEKIYDSYTAGEKDYSALITKLKQASIDVLYVGGYHTEAGLIKRQMAEQGMNTLLVSGDALATAEFWSITGNAGEGTLITFRDARDIPDAATVIETFRKAGYEPEGYTLYSYAAMQVYTQAVQKANGTDMEKVAEAIRANSFDTAIGKLSFDAKGDIKGTAYAWYVWKNGKYSPLPE